MSILRMIFWFVCIFRLVLSIQMNLELTNSSCADYTHRAALPHDCLSVAARPIFDQPYTRQIIQYCLGECPSKWIDRIGENQTRWTFGQLAEQRISSRELYLWSAPIDQVERYQFYLNQPSSLIKIAMDAEFVYNCSWPRFGPLCQYAFDFGRDNGVFSSMSDLIHGFYFNHVYEPETLTCYVHLQCNRGPSSSCLDWSEICDGRIDCLDGGEDEKHCWKLEANEREAN